MSGLMQDRDSFFNDRITHLDDIQFSRNTRTGILIEDEKDFSDVRKVQPEVDRDSVEIVLYGMNHTGSETGSWDSDMNHTGSEVGS